MISDPQRVVGFDAFELRSALEADDELYIQWILSDTIEGGTPDFHLEGFSIMCDLEVRQAAFAWPRGHAKTTLAKAAACKLFLHTPVSFIVYVSNTASLAVQSCVDIIEMLESQNVRSVYGPVDFITRQDGVGFYQFRLNGKLCILRALGAGQQVRGLNVRHRRPQVGICDDLESAEDLQTENNYLARKRWFYGSFRKALDKKVGKIIMIGNMTKSRSLLYDHCHSEAFWVSRIYGAIRGDGTPLWPELYSIEDLEDEYYQYLEAGEITTWFAELMNIVVNVLNGLIKPEKITYAPQRIPGQTEIAVITVDTAYSKRTWANQTAIIVHTYEQGNWYESEVIADVGMDINELAQNLVYLSKKWHPTVIGVESIAYAAAYEPILKYHLQRAGLFSTELVPLIATSQKTQRLAAWCSMLAEGTYKLLSGSYRTTKQLLEYDPTVDNNNDDIIDAEAHIVQLLNKYSALVFQKRVHTPETPKSRNGLSALRQLEKLLNGNDTISASRPDLSGRDRQPGEDSFDADEAPRTRVVFTR